MLTNPYTLTLTHCKSRNLIRPAKVTDSFREIACSPNLRILYTDSLSNNYILTYYYILLYYRIDMVKGKIVFGVCFSGQDVGAG